MPRTTRCLQPLPGRLAPVETVREATEPAQGPDASAVTGTSELWGQLNCH